MQVQQPCLTLVTIRTEAEAAAYGQSTRETTVIYVGYLDARPVDIYELIFALVNARVTRRAAVAFNLMPSVLPVFALVMQAFLDCHRLAPRVGLPRGVDMGSATWTNATWHAVVTRCLPEDWLDLMEDAVCRSKGPSLKGVGMYIRTMLHPRDVDHIESWADLRARVFSGSVDIVHTRVVVPDMRCEITLRRTRGTALYSIAKSLERRVGDSRHRELYANGEKLDHWHRTIEDYGLDEEAPLEYK